MKQLTDTQKKGAWAVGAVLLLVHFAPSIFAALHGMSFPWSHPAPAVISKPSAARYAPSPLPVPTLTPAQLADAQWQKMTGIWAGTTVQLDRGSCKMRLELQSKPDAPEYFSGYSTRVCGPSLPFMNDKVTAGHLKDAYLNQITPVSDILSGIPINGSLTLNLDQAIAKSPDDCQLTSFTLTPFGQSQLAATFTQDKCQGGQLLMGRAR